MSCMEEQGFRSQVWRPGILHSTTYAQLEEAQDSAPWRDIQFSLQLDPYRLVLGKALR